MRWLLPLLLLSPGVFAETFFRLPSYATLQTGHGSDDLKTAMLAAGLSLPRNWQLELSADHTSTKVEGEDVSTSGFLIGGGTDPLEIYSARVAYESWRIPTHVEADGIRIGATYAPRSWLFTLEMVNQTISLSGLPTQEVPSGASDVFDRGLVFRISSYRWRPWNFYFMTSSHNYDKDLTQYADMPALSLLQTPSSVLSTLAGLNESDLALGAVYFFKGSELGVEIGRSISALDKVKTQRLELIGAYQLTRRWTGNASVAAYKPEGASHSSDPSFLAMGGLSYFWF